MLRTAVFLLQFGAAVSQGDPKLLRDARAAQVRFEGIRRMNLPWERTGRSGGPCDAHIGRYCYSYDSTPAAVVPEPERIAAARMRLLAFLDSALARNPSDAWLAGQRIRYLLEAGRPMDAVAAARDCGAHSWWCAALAGLSLHVGERYADADTAFAQALREMPEGQRCEWLDLSLLVESRLARELSRSSCAERDTLSRRLWVLGQPLWSTPGADFRTEHFARLTMAAILDRSANAHGMSWADDSRELLLRYGWAEWFTRRDPGPHLYASTQVTGHDRDPSYAFLPDVGSVRAVPRLTPSVWRLREPAARSRYAPRHIKDLSALPHQLVRLPRGDSVHVLVAYHPSDTALARDSVTYALAAYHDARLRIASSRDRSLSVMLPADTMIVSVEAYGRQTRRASRSRYTVDPLPCGTSWCLSDLLLFAPTDDTDADVTLALSTALTEMTTSARDPLGIFWEIRSPPSLGPAWVSLTIEPIRAGIVRRIATQLRLTRRRDSVRLRWQAALDKPALSQSLTVRLPASARGAYRIALAVEPANHRPLHATREIEVLP